MTTTQARSQFGWPARQPTFLCSEDTTKDGCENHRRAILVRTDNLGVGYWIFSLTRASSVPSCVWSTFGRFL